MAISNVDIKILWGRAGGRCSHPECTEDLTSLVESGNYVVGEMAHVIGNKPTARRGTPEGGEDTYDNLILLCPTHHTHIDKAPEGTYPIVRYPFRSTLMLYFSLLIWNRISPNCNEGINRVRGIMSWPIFCPFIMSYFLLRKERDFMINND